MEWYAWVVVLIVCGVCVLGVDIRDIYIYTLMVMVVEHVHVCIIECGCGCAVICYECGWDYVVG